MRCCVVVHRFAKFVQSDRFVPRSPEDNGATPVYVVLLDAVSEAPPQPPSPEGGLSKAFSSRLDAVTAMAKPMPRIREVLASFQLVASPNLGRSFGPAAYLMTLPPQDSWQSFVYS